MTRKFRIVKIPPGGFCCLFQTVRWMNGRKTPRPNESAGAFSLPGVGVRYRPCPCPVADVGVTARGMSPKPERCGFCRPSVASTTLVLT